MIEEYGSRHILHLKEGVVEGCVVTAHYWPPGRFEDEYGFEIIGIMDYLTASDIYMIQKTNQLLLWKGPELFIEVINVQVCEMFDYEPDYYGSEEEYYV